MGRDEILAAIHADKRNWLNAPWVVAEFYFYRRIVEAFKFFETGYDMFAKQKQVLTMRGEFIALFEWFSLHY